MSLRPVAYPLLLTTALLGLACASKTATPEVSAGGAAAKAAPKRPPGPRPELVVEGGHTNNILSLSLNRDGSLLATTGPDALVKLWDVRMGRELRTFTGHTFTTSVVRFSPDGRTLASAGWDREIRIWGVDEAGPPRVLSGHGGAVVSLVFTPDGRGLVAGGLAEPAVCWDLETGTPKGIYPPKKKGGYSRYSMHPSGQRVLVSGNDKLLAELRPNDCGVLREREFSEPVEQALYSPNGERVALRLGNSKVRVVDASTFTERFAVEAEGLLTYRPDGALVVGKSVFDGTSGRSLGQLPTEPMGYSGDGTLFAGVDETGKWFRDQPSGGDEDPLERNKEVPRSASIYATTTNERVAQVKSPGRIGWYGNMEAPFSLAHSPSEPVLAVGSADGAVRLWDLRKPNGPRLLHRHARVTNAVRFSPQGTFLASCGGSETTVFRVGSGELVLRHPTACNTAAFSDDERTLYVGGFQGTLSRVDLRSGAILRDAEVGRGAIAMVTLAEGEVIAATDESWDFVAFSPDLVEVSRGPFATKNFGGVRLNHGDVSRELSAIGLGYHKMFLSVMDSMPNSPVVVFDRRSNRISCQVERAHGSAGVTRVALNRSGNLVATGGGDGFVRLWDAATCERLVEYPGDAEVWGVEFSHDEKRLAVLGADGAVRLYDIQGARRKVATLVGLGDEDFVIALPDHHFMASRGGLRGVSFRVGLRSIPFEQYDLRLNRPDLVMEALGAAEPDVLSLLRRAHERRLAKMGFTEAMLGDDFALPTVEVLGEVPLSQSTSKLSLRVRAKDDEVPLDRLLVTVNDVPLRGTRGFELRGRGTRAELPLEIELGAGENRISVSVLNERGVESLRETFSVRFAGATKKPNLHVIALGVSRYKDASLNLDYAAKDAKDIARFWKRPLEGFGEVRITEVLDEDVTRGNFAKLRDALEKTNVDDQVVLFMAGHGMLDEKLDYYFVTHDFRRDAPSVNGLPYEAIEGLLDGIPARRKLVLIDTCHSGEVDDGATAAALPVRSGSRSVSGVGTVKIAERKLVLSTETKSAAPAGPTASSLRGLLGELFADLRRGSGAVVISSAGGSEAALESARWKNGVFTFSVLEALDQKRADEDKDQTVRVSELRDYVMKRVSELTQGAQTPTARRENLYSDFPVY